VAVEELLAQEGELIGRAEALAAREDKVRISKQALIQVSAAFDAEQVENDVAKQEYLDKMEAHTAHSKHILDLNKILVEMKVELDGRERDLELRTTALAEAQARGLNPRDNHGELMEFIELWQLLWDVEVDRAIKAS
jgi:hypothetical protein